MRETSRTVTNIRPGKAVLATVAAIAAADVGVAFSSLSLLCTLIVVALPVAVAVALRRALPRDFRHILTACAVAILVIVAVQAVIIVTHDGPFIDFSKAGAAAFVLTLCLWLFSGCVAFLVIVWLLLRLVRLPASFFEAAALLLLLGFVTALDPSFWGELFGPHPTWSVAFPVVTCGLLALAALALLNRRQVKGDAVS